MSRVVIYTPHFKASSEFLMANQDNQKIPIYHHNLMANRDILAEGLI